MPVQGKADIASNDLGDSSAGGGGEEKVSQTTAAGSGIRAVRALSPRKG